MATVHQIVSYNTEQCLEFGRHVNLQTLELEGVPGYPYTRESYVRLAGRSPLCWTPKGLSKALKQARLALD